MTSDIFQGELDQKWINGLNLWVLTGRVRLSLTFSVAYFFRNHDRKL